MVWLDHSLFCDGCGVEIDWAPVVVKQRRYCCQDCADGRDCDCALRTDLEDELRPGRSPAYSDFSTGPT